MRNLGEEQRQQVREMDIVSRAKIVFRYLRKNLNRDPNHQGFYQHVENLRKELFPSENDRYNPADYTKLLEAITLLESRGLVVREISYPTQKHSENKFIICLTSIGIKSNIDDGVILLVDKPEEMVDVLEQRIGVLDSVVRQYYLESLRAYQAELYISSVICLGAASERAIHWLAESIESYSKQFQGKIKTKRNGKISGLTEYLANTVIPNIFGADKKFEVELKDRLNGLGKLYRENRNEAGHPQNVDQSWLGEDQEILLIHFRRYITTICEAIERLNSN